MQVNRSLHKVKDMVIFQDHHYNTFPNAIINKNGELLVAFRQAPDRRSLFHRNLHIDPASKAVYVTSNDNGETWDERSNPLYDDFYYGVQDPCVNVLRDGTLFCSFFTWEVLTKENAKLSPQIRDREVESHWIARPGGVYTIRSQDDGKTWDRPVPMTTDNLFIRGNCVEFEDGSILLPVYGHPEDRGRAMAALTKDKGMTWDALYTLASQEGYLFHEPNLYRTESGKLVAFIRTLKLDENLSDDQKSPLVTCESYDNGKTWVNHQEHAIFSPSPFHILRLQSGRVLVTYGHRIEPYGIHALLLDAECKNIHDAEKVILRNDGPGFDIGYTSAVQLDHGDILVTYYYRDGQQDLPYIAATLCREE